MKRFFQIAAIVDFLFIVYLFSDSKALLNAQIAFISSLLVVIGSFYGYSKMVRSKASLNLHERDYIDKIEDRFDLEGEDIDDPKQLFEEEKKRVKKSGNLKVLRETYRGFFSPYRLVGYLFVIVVVLILIRRGWFDIEGFLMGLAVVPLSALVMALLSSRSDHSSM